MTQGRLSADHLLACDQSRDGVGEVGGLDVLRLEAGVLESFVHSLLRERAHAPFQILPELRHSRSRDDDVVSHDVLLCLSPGGAYLLTWYPCFSRSHAVAAMPRSRRIPYCTRCVPVFGISSTKSTYR